MEINCIPSQLNTSAPTGVASQLASVAENAPHYDGVTIDQMRGNPIYGRGDTIDKVGLAQKQIVKTAQTVHSQRKMIRALNDAAQKIQKPKTN